MSGGTEHALHLGQGGGKGVGGHDRRGGEDGRRRGDLGVVEQVQEGVDPRFDRCQGAVGTFGRLLEVMRHPVALVLDQGGQEGLLGIELPIERTRGEPGLFQDVVDRGPVVAVLRHHPHRGVQEQLALGVRAEPARPAPSGGLDLLGELHHGPIRADNRSVPLHSAVRQQDASDAAITSSA